MCNRLHEDSKPIKEIGKGWKIFKKHNNKYYPVHKRCVEFPLNTKIIWDPGIDLDAKSVGFCFFLRKKEAIRCMKNYKNISRTLFLLPIHYKKGIATHSENGIFLNKNFQIALCKEFKIILE